MINTGFQRVINESIDPGEFKFQGHDLNATRVPPHKHLTELESEHKYIFRPFVDINKLKSAEPTKELKSGPPFLK